MHTYDPYQLVRDIQIHLQLQGLDAELAPEKTKDSYVAASLLLTALGITPAIDGIAALTRASDRIWSDRD